MACCVRPIADQGYTLVPAVRLPRERVYVVVPYRSQPTGHGLLHRGPMKCVRWNLRHLASPCCAVPVLLLVTASWAVAQDDHGVSADQFAQLRDTDWAEPIGRSTRLEDMIYVIRGALRDFQGLRVGHVRRFQ